MNFKKRILVAPLNWGLGHASRCIPLINELLISGFQPIIASDGNALDLLKKEFKNLSFEQLPAYNISYPANGKKLKRKLLSNSLPILKAIKKEQLVTNQLHKKYHFSGIISDNRFGVYLKGVPSVYVTHQINVLSGNSTWLSTKLHQRIIKKFDECWIPDYLKEPSLSGNLGHTTSYPILTRHIGPLSRLSKQKIPETYTFLILLSGPEPQRSILEKKLITEFLKTDAKTILVRGVVEPQKKVEEISNLTIHNFMESSELELAINSSQLIISRSGYSTIMDLSKLNKKAFFIPTPGQFEQEYLAKRLRELSIADFRSQNEFKFEDLIETRNFSGFNHRKSSESLTYLFGLF